MAARRLQTVITHARNGDELVAGLREYALRKGFEFADVGAAPRRDLFRTKPLLELVREVPGLEYEYALPVTHDRIRVKVHVPSGWSYHMLRDNAHARLLVALHRNLSFDNRTTMLAYYKSLGRMVQLVRADTPSTVRLTPAPLAPSCVSANVQIFQNAFDTAQSAMSIVPQCTALATRPVVGRAQLQRALRTAMEERLIVKHGWLLDGCLYMLLAPIVFVSEGKDATPDHPAYAPGRYRLPPVLLLKKVNAHGQFVGIATRSGRQHPHPHVRCGSFPIYPCWGELELDKQRNKLLADVLWAHDTIGYIRFLRAFLSVVYDSSRYQPLEAISRRIGDWRTVVAPALEPGPAYAYDPATRTIQVTTNDPYELSRVDALTPVVETPHAITL